MMLPTIIPWRKKIALKLLINRTAKIRTLSYTRLMLQLSIVYSAVHTIKNKH